jgi:hypothetical protein
VGANVGACVGACVGANVGANVGAGVAACETTKKKLFVLFEFGFEQKNNTTAVAKINFIIIPSFFVFLPLLLRYSKLRRLASFLCSFRNYVCPKLCSAVCAN